MATIVGSASLGNWSAGGSWVGGVPPTANDDVTLTVASIGTLTIDTTSCVCRSLDCTGFVGTLAWGSSKTLSVGSGVAGPFKLVAGMTYTPDSSQGSTLNFVSTVTGNNITTAGHPLNYGGTINFNGVGGGWQNQDAWADPSQPTQVNLTNGAWDLNSNNVGTTGGSKGYNLSSTNSNTRSLTFGTATWFMRVNNATWDCTNSTGMTLSMASGTIDATYAGAGGVVFHGGGLTYGTLTTKSYSSTINIDGANTFGTLTVSEQTGSTNGEVILFGANQTVTGTFTANGVDHQARILIRSGAASAATAGVQRTITAATVTVTYIDIADIAGAGAGSWNVSAVTGGAGDGGNNSGITFSAPKNCYMRTAVSVNWSGGNWYTTSGGSTPISPDLPLLHDTAIFDVNSVTAGSKTITLDCQRIPAVNFTGVANTPAFATGSAWSLWGSLTLVSGMTHTGTGALTISGGRACTFDGGTLTWPTSSTITVDCGAGVYTQARNLASNSSMALTSGTWAGATYTTSFTTMTTNSGTGTFQLGGTMTLTGALAVNGGTLDMNAHGITGNTTTTIGGGTLLLSGQVNGSGAISVTSGTVSDAGSAGELKGTTSAFSGGSSTVRKLTCSSTMALSSTGVLTIPAGGSATFSAMTALSGASCSLVTIGTATFTNTTITVNAPVYIPNLEGT